jgi:hypothetical protein
MLKIALIVPNLRYKKEFLWSVMPSRGLLSLAAVLQKEGCLVQYIDADIDNLSNKEIVDLLLNFDCDLVGITMNTFQTKAAIDLAKAIKKAAKILRLL